MRVTFCWRYSVNELRRSEKVTWNDVLSGCRILWDHPQAQWGCMSDVYGSIVRAGAAVASSRGLLTLSDFLFDFVLRKSVRWLKFSIYPLQQSSEHVEIAKWIIEIFKDTDLSEIINDRLKVLWCSILNIWFALREYGGYVATTSESTECMHGFS